MPYTVDKPPAWMKNLPKGAIRIGVETFNAVLRDTKDEDQARKAAWARIKTKYKKQGDKWVRKATTEGADGQLQGSAGLGICICPKCGAQAEHEQGFECERLNCPTCGEFMAEPAPEARAMVELVITKASLQPDGTMRWQAVASDTLIDQVGDQTTLALFNDWIERVEKNIAVDWLPPPRRPFLGISHYPDLDGFGEAGATERMYVDGNRFKADGPFLDSEIGKALFQAIQEERELIKRGDGVDEPIRISAAWWDIQHSHGSFVFTRRSLFDRCPMCGPRGEGEKQFLKGQLDHLASTRVPINPRTALGLEEKAMKRKTRRDDAASIVGEDLADELEERASELVGKSETEAEESPALVVRAEEEGEEPEAAEVATEAVDDEESQAEKADVVAIIEEPWQPYGGATSLDEAEAYIHAREVENQIWSNWDMFSSVIGNILSSRDEDLDKLGAVRQAVDDFSSRVSAIKANVEDAYLVQSAVKGAVIMSDQEVTTQEQENDPALRLKAAVDAALARPELGREGIAQAVQGAIEEYVKEVKAKIDAVAPPAPGEEVATAVSKALQPLVEQMGLVLAKLGQQPAQSAQVPQQKSFTGLPHAAGAPTAENLPVSPITGQPSKLTEMVRRSTGIVQ